MFEHRGVTINPTPPHTHTKQVPCDERRSVNLAPNKVVFVLIRMENPIEMDQNWGYLHDLENLHLLLQLQMYPDELKLLRVYSIYI